MRKLIIAAACALSLSACEEMNPQTGAEFLALAESSAFFKASSYQVGRSAAAVAQSWRAGAAKCLNRRTQTSGVVGTMPIAGTMGTMPIMGITVNTYVSSVQALSGGVFELTVRNMNHSMLQPRDAQTGVVVFTARVTPAAGGALVQDAHIADPFAGNNPLEHAVRAWAEGASNPCPTMP